MSLYGPKQLVESKRVRQATQGAFNMQNRDDLTRPDEQQTNQEPPSEGDSRLGQLWTNVLQRVKERAESEMRKPGSPAKS
jgi:hypothetical protein